MHVQNSVCVRSYIRTTFSDCYEKLTALQKAVSTQGVVWVFNSSWLFRAGVFLHRDHYTPDPLYNQYTHEELSCPHTVMFIVSICM